MDEAAQGRAEAGAALPPPRLVVLVPAHDEATQIEATLDGLARQTRRADRVIVVADNCSDDTAALARRCGAEVYETVDNADKKAGALNQALVRRFRRSTGTDRRTAAQDGSGVEEDRRSGPRRAELAPSPDLGEDDYVLVMDADTVLAEEFLAVAAACLDADPDRAAAGGLFYGHPGGGLLGQFQRNEYLRYSRDVARTGKVMVLTGTGTLFRVRALRQVADARGTGLPGRRGQVYDTLALTEDNELTLALKSLGWGVASPPACTVTTEIMPTWGDLWRQRMRWQRGALENLRHYGLTRTTARYWGQQVGMGFGVMAFQAYLWLTVLLVTASASFHFSGFWTAIGGIFVIERVATAWRGGWRARVVALLLVPELLYDLFIQAVFARSVVDVLARREAAWHHVATPAP